MSFSEKIHAQYIIAESGKLIGHTTSGKPVYDTYDNKAHVKFNGDDHRDAMCIHAYLYKKGKVESEKEGKKHEASTVVTSGPRIGKIMQKFDENRSPEHGKKLVVPELR